MGWHAEEGTTAEIEIEYHEGNWYISEQFPNKKICCITEDDELIDDSVRQQTIEATVSSFRHGGNGGSSYLFLESPNNNNNPVKKQVETIKPGQEQYDVEDLIQKYHQASVDSIFYNPNWLSEWKAGTKNHDRYRFYLMTEKGATDNSKTQYWKCNEINANIRPVGFKRSTNVNYHQIERDRKKYPNPIDVEYNVGLIESNPVIVSVNNKYFW